MIDHHVHLGEDYSCGFYLDEKTLLNRLDRFNIERAVVFPCPFPKTNSQEPFEDANLRVLRLSEKDKRITPFMFLHPFKNSFKYLHERHNDFSGFKFKDKCHGGQYNYSQLKDSKIMNYVLELGRPILFHTGSRESCRAKNLLPLIEKSSAPIIIAHCADFFKEDLLLISKYSNVYMDISPLNCMLHLGFFAKENLREESLRQMSPLSVIDYLGNLFGNERVVGGTDTPWCDNIVEGGYEKEIKILELLDKKGLKNSFLK